MLMNKYAAVAVTIILLVANTLQTAIVGGLDTAEVLQLVAVTAGAVVTYFVPLAGAWAPLWKVLASVAGAAAAAAVPFFVNGAAPTPEQWVTVLIAGVAALGVLVGAEARASVIDAGTAVPGSPVDITSLPIEAVDPQGVKARTGYDVDLPSSMAGR